MAEKADDYTGGGTPESDIDEYSCDRLSRLPDSIISHILSFRPTKSAVATSVLSTRWRYICHEFTSFDFDNPAPLSAPPSFYAPAPANEKFIDFVNTILLQCTANSVSNFRLRSTSPIRNSVVNSWIIAMLCRDVKVLDIKIPQIDPQNQTLPNRIFAKETLVVLKLSGQGINLPDPSNFLPNLKVFHLDSMNFVLVGQNRGLEISAKGYPSLQDLRFTNAKFSDRVEYLKIRHTTLKKLSLVNLTRMLGTVVDLEFCAPNLRCFECDSLRGDQDVHFAAHIREVKIDRFKGNESDLEFIRCVLLLSSKLESVSLTPAHDGMAKGWPYLVTKQLMKFSRRSMKCELLLN